MKLPFLRISTIDAAAHCDVPCGIYEPSQAKIAVKTCQRMIEQMAALAQPDWSDAHAAEHYVQMLGRRVATLETHADRCKHELYTLWSDFFKPEHLSAHPDLHEVFWKATKLCSKVKQDAALVDAQMLCAAVDDIARLFYAAKGDADRFAAYQRITDTLY